jgi:hypothetical protein
VFSGHFQRLRCARKRFCSILWIQPFLTRPFRLWYDPEQDFISPILDTSFMVKRSRPFLLSGNAGAIGAWKPKPAAADRDLGWGRVLFRQKSFPAAPLANSSQVSAALEFQVSFSFLG